jgi:hypothetical protein
MSNRSDFDFDNDDEEFDFGDQDFDFEDEDDIDFESGLGDDFGDEDLTFDEDEEESRGPSRTFVVIAALMIGLFVVALVALLLLSGVLDTGPSEIDITRTAIAEINATVLAQGAETETQSAVLLLTETQVAFDLTQTALAPTATPTATPTELPTETPTIDPTDAAATAIAQQLALTQTALARPTDTPTLEPTTVADIGAVAQTATALASILLPTVDPGIGGGLVVTPTVETFVPLPTALPDTGLIDDLVAGGAGGVGMIALLLVGLVGVIVVSRRLRSLND